ncbi:hypothetical protein Q1695_016333 [Nippostrongylus brasiliensis]|nr:hypothetical protein Q1695_016333 [Nippostrongylus brasiliensis]
MFFHSDGSQDILQYLLVLSTFLIILFLCCTFHCYLCRRIRRKRRYNDHFEPLDYPSSTLQFVRFSHGRREPKITAARLDNLFNTQK